MKIRVRLSMLVLVCFGLCVSTALAVEKQTAWVSSGKLGGAVSLNGAQCLVGVDAGEFDAMTLSLWLNPAEQMQGETSIFSCFNWQEGALHLLLVEQGNLLLCMNGCSPEEAQTQTPLKPNAWNHVALVYDQKAKSAKVYINGKQDIQVQYDEAVTLELHDFCVGAWNVDPRAFRGGIDDVRIYRKAMSSQATAWLYQGSGSKESLALWWKLDETQGDDVQDYSGNKRHGVLRPAQFEEDDDEPEE